MGCFQSPTGIDEKYSAFLFVPARACWLRPLRFMSSLGRGLRALGSSVVDRPFEGVENLQQDTFVKNCIRSKLMYYYLLF